MRLFCTVDGEPSYIVGYAPNTKGAPFAVVIRGSVDHPCAVPLADCILPKMPKKLQRRIRQFLKSETREARNSLVAHADANPAGHA